LTKKDVRPDPLDPNNPVNNFFSRHYACQHGGKTDGLSKFSEFFMAHCKLMYQQGKFEMPLMFEHFRYTNPTSKSPNENIWVYKDDFPGRQEVIRLNPPAKPEEEESKQDLA
jgi:hypothetical protein